MSDKRETADEIPQSNRRRLYPDRLVLINLAIVLSSASCFGVGLVFGVFFGGARTTESEYQERYLRERELVEPVLAQDPAYQEIKVHRRSSGGIFLSGVVSTSHERTKLFEALVRVFGESRAKELMNGVPARS
jgi:hypothetical protein